MSRPASFKARLIRAAAVVAVAGGLFTVLVLIPAERELGMARRYTRELAALKAIQTVNIAQARFHVQFNRFESSPDEFETSPAAPGYRFSFQTTAQGYVITAVPVSFDDSGRRSFYSDQTQIVRVSYSREPATAGSPEIGAPIPGHSLGAERPAVVHQ